ncbi:MAG: 3-mercaptopyruvate sulfurtransferase [Gemmatimonadales bacterium]
MSDELPALVSTGWLAQRLGRPGLRVVDGSWYLPGSGRSPAEEYAAGHIPGAVFFDLDASSDLQTSLPHMLPSAAAFAQRMAALGLSDSDDLVIYDGSGVNLSAPRVWWTFRSFGHDRVAVLDGGMGKWRRESRPVEEGTVKLPRGRFTARLSPEAVRDLKAVEANLQSRAEQLLDARPAGRFAGNEPEPRPGIRGGHIPGSRNLPFTDLVAPDGTMLPREELLRRIEAAGVDLAQPIVATCGSGTSACVLVLALHLLDRNAAVYDGAWTEWAGRSDTPVASGPSPKG